MATIFGIQFGSRFTSTSRYETAVNQEKEDFERFNKFSQSQLLQRYQELNELVHSGEFEKKVHELKTARFKDTDQYHQLGQFNTLQDSSDIKSYLKFVKSGKASRMKNIEGSSIYQEYQELHALVNSSDFHAERVKKDFKKTEIYKQYKKYKSISKNQDIRFILKTMNSSEFKNWQKSDGSERLTNFFELEALVQSDEFIRFKTYMEDKKRFHKSEEARIMAEFSTLEKNEDIKWYLHRKANDPFKEFKKWHLTFEDDFDGVRLDHAKWMTGYYWGKALMNETYVLAGEKQFFKDENIDMRDSFARITTRKEDVKGKIWDQVHGFLGQDFNYTSGLISTGQSFRQKYGKFEAKVRFSDATPFLNAFWMVGESIAPQIDVFKTSIRKGKMVECGVHVIQGKQGFVHQTKNINGANFTGSYYIYSLEWSSDLLIWKINGLEVNRQTQNIPQEPMYLTFCTSLVQEPDNSKLPAALDIDWVRCYQRV